MSTLSTHIFSAVDPKEWKEIKEEILKTFKKHWTRGPLVVKDCTKPGLSYNDLGDTGEIEDWGNSLAFLWDVGLGFPEMITKIGTIDGVAMLSSYSNDS